MVASQTDANVKAAKHADSVFDRSTRGMLTAGDHAVAIRLREFAKAGGAPTR